MTIIIVKPLSTSNNLYLNTPRPYNSNQIQNSLYFLSRCVLDILYNFEFPLIDGCHQLKH